MVRTERLGDEPVGSGLGRVRAAEEDVELGRTRAVRNTDSGREHDAEYLFYYQRGYALENRQSARTSQRS